MAKRVEKTVKKGENLLKFDLDYIRKHAKSDATVMVFSNLNENQKLELMKLGKVKLKEEIIQIK